MKKTFSHILPVAAAFLFFSCNVDQLQEAATNELVQKDFTFEASLAESNTNPGTKTVAVLDDDAITTVRWSPSDAINVFFVAGETVTEGQFTNSATEESDRTSFRGSIDVFSGTYESPVDDQMFWAVYPYSGDNTCDGTSVTFSIPAAQSSRAGSFSDGQWPTMARSNGLNLPFYAICSGIKFKVAQEGVTSVTFTNKDGGAINGTITAGWDADNRPVISGVADGTDQIVVTPEGTDTFTVGSLYFVVLPTVTMSQGIEVTYTTPTSHCTYVNDSEISFTRNNFNKLYNKDTDYEDIPMTPYYKVTEIESGQAYLLVSNDYALKNDNGSVAAEAVTDNDGIIELADATNLLWTVESSDGKFAFENDGYRPTVTKSGSSYSATYTLSLSNAAVSSNSQWSVSSDFIVNNVQYSRKLYYSSGWKVGSSSKYTYFYSINAPKQSRDLAFAKNSIYVTIGNTPEANPLSGETDGVVYSSDDTSIAEVDPATGAVTIKGVEGSTTIRATAEANDTFKAGEASYTIKVFSSMPRYVKVTTAPSDWSGTYLFVNESSNVAFAYDQDNYKVSVTITDGEINSYELTNYELTVSKSDVDESGDKYEIKTTNDKYVYKYGSSSILFDSNISNKNQYYALFSGNGDVTINCQRSGGSDNYFQYSGSAFGFGSDDSATIQLYKLDDGSAPAKANRNLAFAEANVNKTVGDDAFTNTLSGVVSGVEYSSDNTSVATVDATSGLVTIVGAGSATITASADETDEYNADEASFTLTVAAAPSGNVKTFTKVTAFTSDKNYVIVDESKTTALKNDNGTDAAYSVSGKISGNTLTVPEEDGSPAKFRV